MVFMLSQKYYLKRWNRVHFIIQFYFCISDQYNETELPEYHKSEPTPEASTLPPYKTSTEQIYFYKLKLSDA